MADFSLKRNDRLPALVAILRDAAGVAVNLTGATVRIHMQPYGGGAVKVNAPATIVDAVAGRVSYAWAAADTDTGGLYSAEWQVTFSGGLVQTFPNDGHMIVHISEDLA